MSDVGSLSAKDRERSNSFRFATYVAVIILFVGANLAYRLQGAAFDCVAGFVFSIVVYTVVGYLKRGTRYTRLALRQVLSYRQAEFKISRLFKGTGIWYLAIPIVAMPVLLYSSDFPIQLIRFGSAFLIGYLGIYLLEIRKALRFYRTFGEYVDWVKLEADLGAESET